MQSRTMRGAGCGGEQSGREREGEVVGRGGQDGFDRVGRMRLKGGRDLLLAHKDLVVVLDEAARTVTREDVPSVGVGDGLLPAHLPAHLLPSHLLPSVALLLPSVALLLLPIPLLLAVALLLAIARPTVLHRHGRSRRCS